VTSDQRQPPPPPPLTHIAYRYLICNLVEVRNINATCFANGPSPNPVDRSEFQLQAQGNTKSKNPFHHYDVVCYGHVDLLQLQSLIALSTVRTTARTNLEFG